ncbi:MAG: DUF6090 family protein [Bacteroidota bacterium]
MGKYFKYAIGEILLVVLGILIALQINNWNENRRKIEQGQVLMQELIEEFKLHINAFDYGLENQIESFERQRAIFEIKDLEKIRVDSLAYIVGVANIDINISSNTYEKIKNQGIGKLTDNYSLNKAINYHLMERIGLYNRRIDYYFERNKGRINYINESSILYRNNLIKGLPKVNDEDIKKSVLNFLNEKRTKGMVVTSYYDKISAINYLIAKKKTWIELMQAIHKELSQSKPYIEPLPIFDKYLDYKIEQ